MKAVVACALAALVGASLADTAAASEVDTSAQQLPSVAPSDEAERSYLHHDYLFVEDESLYVAVQSVIDTLLAKQPGHRPRLLIYSAENFSAAADTEGNILISTGTLRKLDSEDELAALLGHELAHLIEKHPSKKSFMQRFPVGVDSYSAIVAAGDRLQKSAGKAEQSDTRLNQKRVAHSQNVSLFWSDILAPSWNRKDEQQADRLGLEMMQAAGYDPRAVVTLIAKLAEASMQRSQRMQALCDEMVAHEQKRRLKTSSDNQLTQAATLEVDNLRGKGSEKLIREGFDELLKFSSPYSSNDQRIEQIKQEFATGGGRDMAATKKLKYRRQAKDNGELLNLDELAIAGMSSLAREDVPAGIEALRQVAAAKSTSPHFKLAVGAYYEAQNEPVKSDSAILEWLAAPRAPVIAFVLHADYQSSRQNYSGVLATLDAGRTRLGAPVPFLPPMITAARLNKDEALAERLTVECKAAEEQSFLVKTANVFTGGKPTGVYAECITRLGRLPAAAQGEGGWLKRLKL